MINIPENFNWPAWVARWDRMQERTLVGRAERFSVISCLVRDTQGPTPLILDLGCGSGEHARFLKPLTEEYSTAFTGWARYFFTEEFDYEDRARAKWLNLEGIPERLEGLANKLEACADWTPEAIEALVREAATTAGVKAAEMIHPCRAAVTGTTIGPSLFHLLALLPQATVVARLRKAADLGRKGELAPREPVTE